MNKSKLLSLLAIPIFSVVSPLNAYNTTISNPLNSYQESKKIKTKQIGAAVLDFLLRNPKTANKMNPTEKVALGIIGDILKTQDQREHEIETAETGRDQVIFNVDDGRQAQFFQDETGQTYIIVGDKYYPLAQEFINQARGISINNISGIENATLSPYNRGRLEALFNSNPKEDVSQQYNVQKGGEYLSDISEKFNVSPENIFYWDVSWPTPFKKRERFLPIKQKKKIWQNKKKMKGEILYIVKEKYKNEISAIFSCKWYRDLNQDGALGFDEFNQIKRTFYDDEDVNIGIKYQTEKGFRGNLEVKILEDNTGKLLIDEKTEIFSNGPMIGQQYIPTGTLPTGVYLIYANLVNENSGTVSSETEKFEIVEK